MVLDQIDQLLHIDARKLGEVLSLDEDLFDVIITSPPYWNLKDYGVPEQIGYGQGKAEYLSDIERVLNECFCVTKNSGSLWLVIDTYRQDNELQLLPFELAEVARNAGWQLRDLIVWDKQYSVPWQAKGQLRNTVEFILFMTKSNNFKYHVDRIKTLDELSKWWVDFPERFNPKGKTPSNLWSIPTRPRGAWRKPSENDHYCSFPTALVARIIELTTDPGDIVFDPFAGSGVVLAQARAMERHYLGFEVNADYIQIFEKNVKAEVQRDWEEMQVWRKTQETARLDFEQTIMRLRALKYTRQVTRPFTELSAEQLTLITAVLCIANIPAHYQQGQPFEVKILIVTKQIVPEFPGILESAKKRAKRPPLTQYGIESTIEIVLLEEVEPATLGNTFYLYPLYKPHSYSGTDTLEAWFEGKRLQEMSEPEKIPMLANIAVDVAWVISEK